MTRLGFPLASGLLCLLLANVAQAAPTTQPSDVEKENAALKERIAALEARVKTLERQLRDVRAGRGPFIIPTPTPPEPWSFPEMPRVPQFRSGTLQTTPAPREGWVEREINGIRFYLVPLKEDNAGR